MKLRLLPFLVLANVSLFAQTSVENLSMGPGYVNDIYYSLENGVVQTAVRNDWHIAFTTKIVDAAILTNTSEGVNLYLASTDIADWATLDTTGMSWDPLHNSDLYWTEGSFNAGATVHPNYGWGTYNNITHNVIGTKIFVIQFPDMTYKKILIEAMKTNGDFEFKIADLDGMNEISKTLNKGDYPKQNFLYYNAQADSAFSREPDNTTWDLIFTKFESELSPGVWYPVTGALQNIGIGASEARGVDTTLSKWYDFPTSDTVKNVIGGDWKDYAFNPPPGAWTLADSLTYFVKTANEDMYRIVFKTWEGSATGNFSFAKTLTSTIGLVENSIEDLKIYPNPATDKVYINANETVNVEVISLNGQVVRSFNTIENESIDISGIKVGNYIVIARGEQKVYVSKLSIL